MKKSPFIVPEGYFEDFAERMRPQEAAARRSVPVARRVIGFSAAAVAAAALIAGVLLYPAGQTQDGADAEDLYISFLYSDLVSEADPESIFIPKEELQEYDGWESGVTEDDIVEYLISSGASAEEALQLLDADTTEQYEQ